MKRQLIKFKVTILSGKVFLSLTLFLLSGFVYSQNLTEKLGGITTDFEIISDTNTLEVIDQVIIKRGLSDSKRNISLTPEGVYAYGYGLQTYRLEFITPNELVKIEGRYPDRYQYGLEFIDGNGYKLMEIRMTSENIISYLNEGNFNIYSVNLQNIPLIVLNKTRTIKCKIVAVDKD